MTRTSGYSTGRAAAAIALAGLLVAGCSTSRAAELPTSTAAVQQAVPTSAMAVQQAVPAATVAPAVLDLTQANDPSATVISLGSPIAVTGAGASTSQNTVTIAAGGTYRISGTLADGQIVVAAPDDEDVQLVLEGASITSSTSAALAILSADEVQIILASGTENYLADGASRVAVEAGAEELDAALYSASDLAIGGSGSLRVDGRFNDGIASRDDVDIVSGSMSVTSVGDGIQGRDRLAVADGTITVRADADGLKSTNDEDPERGFISVSGGTLAITAREDGMQAETDVVISGGQMTLTTGGGATSASPGADASAKGIKAVRNLIVDSGTITVDAADDALHSNANLSIRGGTLVLRSADDGMHADTALDISGGDITISDSYEGIESAQITINDGRIEVRSRDDGINVAGGNDGSAVMGRPGQNTFSASADSHLYVNGGSLVVDAAGDGLDANGAIDMTGGLVVVHGPTANGNGALDYDRGFAITGGTLIAAGSSGMAQAPGATSSQASVLVNLPAAQPAGTVVHIATQSGQELLTFAPTKAYQSVVVSSPELTNGMTYNVSTGGSSSGTVEAGVYSGGVYSGGAQSTSFTVSGVVTTAGAAVRGGFPRR